MMPSEMKRLRELEDENGRLKRIVADLWLDQEMLQDIVRVSWWMRCAPRERYRLRSSDSNARRRLVLGLTLRSFNSGQLEQRFLEPNAPKARASALNTKIIVINQEEFVRRQHDHPLHVAIHPRCIACR